MRLLVRFKLSFGRPIGVILKPNSFGTIFFFIPPLVAEAFDAGGVDGEASWIAHVLLVMAVIFIIISFVTGRRARLPFDPTNSVLVSEESTLRRPYPATAGL